MTIIRKGDIVTVRAKVVADANEDGVYVDIGYSQYGSRIDLDRVEVVEPHFNVGELVTIHGAGATGTVIGAVDGHVWVRHTFGGTFGTYPPSSLRLAAPPVAPVDLPPIEAPPPAPYIAGVEERTGGSLADRTPDLPHLADALADF